MSEESDALLHIADDHPCCKPTLLWTHNRLLELERENAALRLGLEGAQMSLDNWIAASASHAVRVGELEAENAALREALQSAENGLRHALMMEPLDPFKRGKIISEALDVVRAARKEAQP